MFILTNGLALGMKGNTKAYSSPEEAKSICLLDSKGRRRSEVLLRVNKAWGMSGTQGQKGQSAKDIISTSGLLSFMRQYTYFVSFTTAISPT